MTTYPPFLIALRKQLAEQLQQRQWRLATAESCTGGALSSFLTDMAGSSAWFDAALVTYANQAKTALLGVDATLIEAHGAVSEPVARAMAQGCLTRTDVDLSVAITGIAGPDGGSADKPVGTVWIALATCQNVHANCHHFTGDRQAVREQAVIEAMKTLVAASR